jgi:hypothetical protein
MVKNKQIYSTENEIFSIQDIIMIYDHNTYFLSSPVISLEAVLTMVVCKLCLDLNRGRRDNSRMMVVFTSV